MQYSRTCYSLCFSAMAPELQRSYLLDVRVTQTLCLFRPCFSAVIPAGCFWTDGGDAPSWNRTGVSSCLCLAQSKAQIRGYINPEIFRVTGWAIKDSESHRDQAAFYKVEIKHVSLSLHIIHAYPCIAAFVHVQDSSMLDKTTKGSSKRHLVNQTQSADVSE